MVKDKPKPRSVDKPFYNVRIRSAQYYAIGEWAFHQNRNVARCIEDALTDFCRKNGIEVDA